MLDTRGMKYRRMAQRPKTTSYAELSRRATMSFDTVKNFLSPTRMAKKNDDMPTGFGFVPKKKRNSQMIDDMVESRFFLLLVVGLFVVGFAMTGVAGFYTVMGLFGTGGADQDSINGGITYSNYQAAARGDNTNYKTDSSLEGKMRAAHLALGNYEYFDFDNSLVELAESYCYGQVHGERISEAGKRNFHAQLSHMFSHIEKGGVFDHLTQTNVVFARNGAIFNGGDSKFSRHKQMKCDLLPAVIQFGNKMNGGRRGQGEPVDAKDMFTETYADYFDEHEGDVNMMLDVKADAAQLIETMKDMGTSDQWEREYALEAHVNKHCPKFETDMGSAAFDAAIKQTYRFVDNILTANKHSEEFHLPEDFTVRFDANGNLFANSADLSVDGIGLSGKRHDSIDKSGKFYSCELIDILFHFQSGKLDDRITKLVTELQEDHLVAFEAHLGQLLDSHCPTVVGNLGGNDAKNALSGHLQDMIFYMLDGAAEGMGTDYVVVGAGNKAFAGSIIHRESISDVGVKANEVFECPVVNRIIEMYSKSDQSGAEMDDEWRFSEKNTRQNKQLEKELEELKQHKYFDTVDLDVEHMVRHYQLGEHAELKKLSCAMAQHYHHTEWHSLSQQSQLNLCTSVENAAVHMAQEKYHDAFDRRVQDEDESVLLVSASDGYVYAFDVERAGELLAAQANGRGEAGERYFASKLFNAVKKMNFAAHDKRWVDAQALEKDSNGKITEEGQMELEMAEVFGLISGHDYGTGEDMFYDLVSTNCGDVFDDMFDKFPELVPDLHETLEERATMSSFQVMTDLMDAVESGKAVLSAKSHIYLTPAGVAHLTWGGKGDQRTAEQKKQSTRCDLLDDMVRHLYEEQRKIRKGNRSKGRARSGRKKDDGMTVEEVRKHIDEHVEHYEENVSGGNDAEVTDHNNRYYVNHLLLAAKDNDILEMDRELKMFFESNCASFVQEAGGSMFRRMRSYVMTVLNEVAESGAEGKQIASQLTRPAFDGKNGYLTDLSFVEADGDDPKDFMQCSEFTNMWKLFLKTAVK